MKTKGGIYWTTGDLRRLRELVEGEALSMPEAAQRMRITYERARNACTRYGIKSSAHGNRFSAERQPAPERRRTGVGNVYRVGNVPHTAKPAGATWLRPASGNNGPLGMIKPEGYRTGVPLLRYVYERAVGPIPKGSLVVSLSGDPLDARLANIEVRTRAEHMQAIVKDLGADGRRERAQAISRSRRGESLVDALANGRAVV